MTEITDEQIRFLRENRQSHKLKTLTRLFNERFKTDCTKGDIDAICREQDIGLSPVHFDEARIKWIAENRAEYRQSELIKLYEKTFHEKTSIGAINALCRRMGIKTDKMRWTDEMHEFADANRPKYPIAELTEMFNKKFGTHLASRQMSMSLARCSSAPAYQKKKKYSDEEAGWIAGKIREDISYNEITELYNEKFHTSITADTLKRRINNMRYALGSSVIPYSSSHGVPVGTISIRKNESVTRRVWIKSENGSVPYAKFLLATYTRILWKAPPVSGYGYAMGLYREIRRKCGKDYFASVQFRFSFILRHASMTFELLFTLPSIRFDAQQL